ncbi:MAG: hypothetical protein A3C88_01085 [Candidatus Yanofskybacteria bacterium RIFCSPHIGHO2_02_FULL_50_12]|uniref:Uncharacterized protein n=1 Tax=Candidatus Yanofskybacteria bacterium RIFCSPHIGHO2_02_FULL_50_12 TaxID=1802685 RepID=A0A1F8FWM4_9BACT|nr:MAG: hypothetical protein A3C88_01085 [Candidatus Yanofskybacteria bacterium RIFCSPHIGHO2_02_FULL_50_12]
MEKPQFEQKERYKYNLLNNFESTLNAITQVEGEAWANSNKRALEKGDIGGTIFGALEALKRLPQSEQTEDSVAYTILGSGGVSRWIVVSNGDVKFSIFHDQVQPRNKTHKAEAMGFKMFE